MAAGSPQHQRQRPLGVVLRQSWLERPGVITRKRRWYVLTPCSLVCFLAEGGESEGTVPVTPGLLARKGAVARVLTVDGPGCGPGGTELWADTPEGRDAWVAAITQAAGRARQAAQSAAARAAEDSRPEAEAKLLLALRRCAPEKASGEHVRVLLDKAAEGGVPVSDVYERFRLKHGVSVQEAAALQQQQEVAAPQQQQQGAQGASGARSPVLPAQRLHSHAAHTPTMGAAAAGEGVIDGEAVSRTYTTLPSPALAADEQGASGGRSGGKTRRRRQTVADSASPQAASGPPRRRLGTRTRRGASGSGSGGVEGLSPPAAAAMALSMASNLTPKSDRSDDRLWETAAGAQGLPVSPQRPGPGDSARWEDQGGPAAAEAPAARESEPGSHADPAGEPAVGAAASPARRKRGPSRVQIADGAASPHGSSHGRRKPRAQHGAEADAAGSPPRRRKASQPVDGAEGTEAQDSSVRRKASAKHVTVVEGPDSHAGDAPAPNAQGCEPEVAEPA